jgi:hypothetical protein
MLISYINVQKSTDFKPQEKREREKLGMHVVGGGGGGRLAERKKERKKERMKERKKER